MATQQTFYLRDTTPTGLTLPSGYLGAWNVTNSAKAGANARATGTSAGSSTVTSSVSSGAGSKQGCAQFCSPPLAAQTISSGNWTGGWSVKHTSGIMSHQGACAIYLVNGSTGAVRSTIFALANVGTSRVSTTGKTAYSASLSGSSVSVTAGDYLVFEIGTNKIGASSDVGSALYDGGTTISSDNTANTTPASFFTAPAAITLQGDQTIDASSNGIASAEALGTPQVMNDLILATGIATASAFGSATVSTNNTVDLDGQGIASAEAVGTPISVIPDQAVTLGSNGIPSGEALGSATVTADNTILTTGIPSAGALGTPQVMNDLVIVPGNDFSGLLGEPGVTATNAIVVGGNDFSGSVGTPDVTPGAVNINATGIPSGEAFGSPSTTMGIDATGITTGEDFGIPLVTGGIYTPLAGRSRMNLIA